ncbi:MAG: hypothetical protein K2N29_00865 [Ruminiclostridium sp.]|nr:hypothetical protein [Ruminiclostridium sp.]
MYTNKGLVKHAEAALKLNTKYMWGGILRPITDGYIDMLAKLYQNTAQYPAARVKTLRGLVGKNYFGCDCVGLIKSYYWSGNPGGGTGSPSYGKAGFPDVNAHGMYNAAKVKGTIDTIPEVPGLVVYCKSRPHVGVYVGNGYTIESTLGGGFDGIVKRKLKDWIWEYWFECPYITYEKTAEKPQEKPATVSLKVGDKVTIRDAATNYAGASKNVKIPARYKGGSNTYTISKVSGEMSLLKELYSWAWNKDLDRK